MMLIERAEYLSGAAAYNAAADEYLGRTPASASHDGPEDSSRHAQAQLRLTPGARAKRGVGYQLATTGGAPTVVVYHHLSSTPHPLTDELGVSTDPEVFRRHVKYFTQNFDLISPSDLIAGTLPKRPLLITFDDVYRSVLEVGGPILREANVQSVWFMNPDCLEAETLPLDNLLTLAVDHYGSAGLARLLSLPGEPPASVPALISDYISTLNYAQIAALKATISAGLPQSQTEIRRNSGLFIDAADLKRLPEFGIQIGNHSLTHAFFRSLTPAELHIEIGRSRESLERLSGQQVSCLAIPYGNELDATEAALAIARSSGHRAVFLVHGRSNAWRPAGDVFYRICADRLRPEFLPVSMGILPRLRSLRDWLR
jgi:peptidoglycan/xylan/chitin deacetylase (PgdA/CDA1 family)